MLNVRFASESDPETDVTLSFFAADRLIGEVVFSERFLFDVGQMIQKKSAYHLNETLRNVRLPSGQGVEGQFLFIVAKSLKENLDFGVLFNRLDSGGYHIIGLWPRDFAEICKQDNEVFEFLMFRLINTPEFFGKVTMYQSAEMPKPRMEVKPPEVEIRPPAVPAKTPFAAPTSAAPAAAAEVKAAVKPAGVEVKPTPAAAAPPAAPAAEAPPDLLAGRCPFCKAPIPEPRLKVLQRGSNTFCPKCLKILKGFSAAVPITPVEKEGDTKKEMADLVKQSEQAVKAGNFDKAASDYRRASGKAKLIQDKRYASELEQKAEAAMTQDRKGKIDQIMKSADDFFRQKSYDDAIKEYKIAIDLAKKIKDNELLKSINTRIRKCAELIVTEKIEGFINAADQLIKEENYQGAKQNNAKALELEEKLGEKDIIADLKQKITDCDTIPLKKKLKEASSKAEKQFKIDKFEEAIQYYQEAASYASQLNDGEAQGFFQQKIVECRTTPLRRNAEEAIRTGDSQLQAQDFNAAANSYRNALNMAKELADSNLSQKIEQKITQCAAGESGVKLQALLQEANNAFSQKDYATATGRYQEAIRIAKEIGDSDSVRSSEGKIKECDVRGKIDETLQKAETNYQSQNYELALSLYQDLSKLATSINDTQINSNAVAKIEEIQKSILSQKLAEATSKADILMSEQKYADAKQKLQQAQTLANQLNDATKIEEVGSKISQCDSAIKAAEDAAKAAAAAAAAPAPAPAPAAPAPEVKEEKKAIEPSGFLCPFCDYPLTERVVKNLKKGFNDNCPNCGRTLGRLALNL